MQARSPPPALSRLVCCCCFWVGPYPGVVVTVQTPNLAEDPITNASAPSPAIMYDVTVIKFPTSALRRTPVTGEPASMAAPGDPESADEKQEDGSGAAAQSSQGEGEGGAVPGAVAVASSSATAPASITVAKRWAVTSAACYHLKVCHERTTHPWWFGAVLCCAVLCCAVFCACVCVCLVFATTDARHTDRRFVVSPPCVVARLERVRVSPTRQSVFGLRDGQDCVVCLTEPKSVILLPCRHMCVCATCFSHLDKCPVCRAQYESHATFQGRVCADDSGSDSDDSSFVQATGGQHASLVASLKALGSVDIPV